MHNCEHYLISEEGQGQIGITDQQKEWYGDQGNWATEQSGHFRSAVMQPECLQTMQTDRKRKTLMWKSQPDSAALRRNTTNKKFLVLPETKPDH